MFNFIKQCFSIFAQPKTEHPTENNNVLMVSVDDNGFIKIKITINDATEAQGRNFGNMLFLLNESYCTQSILDIFNDIVKSDKTYVLFIKNAIDQWSSKILEVDGDDEKILNEPIIPPTTFCKGAKQ